LRFARNHTVGKIDRRDFRLEFEANMVFIDDRWFEIQAHAIFLEYDRHRTAITTSLDHRNRKLAAG